MNYALIPNFSVPLPAPAATESVQLHASVLDRLETDSNRRAFAPVLIEVTAEPASALVRISRAISSIGEMLAGFILIGGGCALIGLSTHL